MIMSLTHTMKKFNIIPVNSEISEAIQEKIDLKTKPLGSLGVLEKLALQIGSIQCSLTPSFTNPQMFVFAGDHGIAHEGVSPFPQEVTYQMVMNFVQGGAAINVFCRQHGIDISIVDAGVNYDFPLDLPIIRKKVGLGTASYLCGPAMTVQQRDTAIAHGADLVRTAYDAGSNVVAFGEMGIGNTSSSALIMHKICGIDLADCVGRGTGHSDEGMKHKLAVLERCASNFIVKPDALAVLTHFGGFETVMVCGAMLQAAELGMTILVDGFNITAALLCAAQIEPNILDYCVATHLSGENGHAGMLKFLGLIPVLNLGMRLGEGTGAAVAYPVIESALKFVCEMASFEDAGVSNA